MSILWKYLWKTRKTQAELTNTRFRNMLYPVSKKIHNGTRLYARLRRRWDIWRGEKAVCFAEKGWTVLINRWYCLLTLHCFGTSTYANLFSLEKEDGDHSIFSPSSSTLASSGSSVASVSYSVWQIWARITCPLIVSCGTYCSESDTCSFRLEDMVGLIDLDKTTVLAEPFLTRRGFNQKESFLHNLTTFFAHAPCCLVTVSNPGQIWWS